VSRTNWKQVERDAAKHFGATRFPANMGGRLDFEGPDFIGQVKNLKVCSLAALEKLANEMLFAGVMKEKAGVVVVKRSAGAGRETPFLVLMTMKEWDKVYGMICRHRGEG
jgi:hypothetical protein